MDKPDHIDKELTLNNHVSYSPEQDLIEKDIIQLNRLYSTFSRIYQVIVNAHDRDEVFQKICTIAVTYGKLQMAWFGLIDESGSFLKPTVFAGRDYVYLRNAEFDLTHDDMIQHPVVQSVREGRCIMCRDISTDPRMEGYRKDALKKGFRSSVTVPVREKSKLVGAFTAYAYDLMMFDDLELTLFEEIGMAISFALDNIENEKQKNIILKKLEKSEERFREMFDDAPIAYHELDDQGHIVKINNAELTMLGYTAEEVIGMNAWDLVYDTEASHQRVLKKLKGTEPLSQYNEFKLLRKDGSNIIALAQDKLIRNYQGTVTGIRTTLLDITELKKAEKELLIAKEKAEESDRLKTAFLHNITHEIRTPMNAIVGFSGLINDPALDAGERKRYADVITQSSKQLLSIITNIVNIATVEAGQEKIHLKKINLNSILRQVNDQYSLNAKKENISLSFALALPDEEAFILTDEIKLKEVLDNLIGNALKFTLQGAVDFGYDIKREFLEFHVKDTGIGIPEAKQPDIFKRFYQVEMDTDRRFGGSGLGLSISKAYVELLGGKIWLTSQPCMGSEFFFTIPYRKADSKDLDKKRKMRSPVKSEVVKTLLIAEDEDLNFLLLEKLLADTNVRIVRAVNGLEAVETCKSNQGIDLVLMDLKMPVVNGYDATRQILEYSPDLPVIIQTAYVNEADRNKVFECGCSDVICKPVDQELLISKIWERLDK
jgi:PAS domain S-box-containing protein